MAKGIIYIMTSVIPGLVKIGQTTADQFETRMSFLEHNGYCNVTGLKRAFAIEVEKYIEKEKLLHTIFAKSRVANTECFAIDVNTVIKLLSSFDGQVVFPNNETKAEIFDEAVENSNSQLIPDGEYTLERIKQSDNKTVYAKAKINNKTWTLLQDSILGVNEDAGVSQKAKMVRVTMPLDDNGRLLEDVELGECSPSFAGVIVMNAACNGWAYWKNSEDKPVGIYRQENSVEN